MTIVASTLTVPKTKDYDNRMPYEKFNNPTDDGKYYERVIDHCGSSKGIPRNPSDDRKSDNHAPNCHGASKNGSGNTSVENYSNNFPPNHFVMPGDSYDVYSYKN